MIRIIIYGMGNRGKDFIQYVKRLSVDMVVIAVSDSYIQTLKIDEDIPFIKLSDIPNYVFDYIVVTPKDHYEDIKKNFLDIGIDENKIKSIKDIYQEYGRFYYGYLTNNDLYCNLCDNHVSVWCYIGLEYNLFHKKKIIGGSRRRGGCPICGGSDRERYVYYILKSYINLMDGRQHSILHFAPEDFLSTRLRQICGSKYISADIVPGRADVVADITRLDFADETFEYMVCNHVMEHIDLERKAFSEIKRCLIVGGVLILTVPICWEQKTFEDSTINSEEARIKYYGQKDHVRLYGNDIVERIKSFGFHVTLLRCDEVVNENDISKYGFIKEDSVLLCKKK
ncbi:MAG: class I SAM-dependent methyltransferase [Lachnospiraceae bacterium]|nr:class I SAM-dependent methyltransferase [Lachnospiraceae bacterium]